MFNWGSGSTFRGTALSKFIYLALILITISLSASTAQATSTEITGETTITSPGHYHLNQSLTDQNVTNSSFIRIETSNVTIDGRGHALDCIDESSPPTGIYAYNSSQTLTNVTVTNVTLTDWGNGVHFEDVENSTVISTNISNSESEGIRLELSDNATAQDNTLISNKQGILLHETGHTTITNNTAINNPAGIEMKHSDNNTISNNSVTSSDLAGIFFMNPSHHNEVRDNHINDSHTGIYIKSSDANNVTNNKASTCQITLHLEYSNGTLVEDNELEGTNQGAHIKDSERATLKNNTLGEGLLLEGSALPYWNTHTITNNTADGGVVDYRKNLTGTDISSATGQLILANVSNSTVHDFNVSGAYNGIVLGFSENNTLQNLTASSNEGDGLRLVDSPNCTVTNVTAGSNGGSGIELDDSPDVTITDSTAPSNGLNIDSSSNVRIVDVDTSNSDGFVITHSPSATLTNCTASSHDEWGFNADNSPDSVLRNCTARGGDTASSLLGFYLSNSANISVSGSTATAADDGFTVTNSPNVTLSNNSASDNTRDVKLDSERATLSNNTFDTGIELTGDTLAEWTTHTITNNTADGETVSYVRNQSGAIVPTHFGQLILANVTNTEIRNLTVENTTGISLGFSDNNTIRNVTATNNTDGIRLSHSDNNTITDIVARDNVDGIYLRKADNNTIRNVTTNSNGNGMYISGSGNTLTGNTLKSNTNKGLSVSPDDNLIYNNLFKNSDNVFVHLTVSGSDISWNVSKRPGTNVVGGSHIGGNYWASPDGSGFSQTASDSDGDGIADSTYIVSELPYTQGETDVDHLPLTNNGPPAGSEGDDDSDGWNGPPAPDIQENQYEIKTFITVREGDEVTIDTSDEQTPVTGLELQVEKTVYDPAFNLATHDSPPNGAEEPEGTVYRYFSITTSMEQKDIETVKIRFRVPNEWFRNRSVTPARTTLAIKESGMWRELDTNATSRNSENTLITAEAPHLSTFAIIGAGANETPAPTPLDTLSDQLVENDSGKIDPILSSTPHPSSTPLPTRDVPGPSVPLTILAIAAVLTTVRRTL